MVCTRLNVLIAGVSGSRETALLNVPSGFIPANKRIITIVTSIPQALRLATGVQMALVGLEKDLVNAAVSGVQYRGLGPQKLLVQGEAMSRPGEC